MNSPNSFFALDQLMRAVRAGSTELADKWRSVLAGMDSGQIVVGSRSPVVGYPIWVTPEVVRGGFATGKPAAGGELQSHEKTLGDSLDYKRLSDKKIRHALNTHFSSLAGQAELREWARTDTFSVQTPEECALISLALLEDREMANEIISILEPFFCELRFFPAPASTPRPAGLHVQTVAEVKSALGKKRTSIAIKIQDTSLSVWLPIYDRVLNALRTAVRQDEARSLIQEIENAFQTGDRRVIAKRWTDPSGVFQRCVAVLRLRAEGAQVPNRDAKFVKLHLIEVAKKYSKRESIEDLRIAQVQQQVRDRFDDLGPVMIDRLNQERDDGGLHEMEAYLGSLRAAEDRSSAVVGTAMPTVFTRILQRAKSGTIQQLFDAKLIKSSEVLATLTPQFTAKIACERFPAQDQKNVFSALYRSFAMRRSLLLLNYESQVRLEELPWATALLSGSKLDTSEVAKFGLQTLIVSALKYFPEVPFPNPLVQEMISLSAQAGIDVQFTKELAADIFMGGFTVKFDQAAAFATAQYADSLYGRYFDFPLKWKTGSLQELAHKRADVSRRRNFSVVANAQLIEQQMILTTQNLGAALTLIDEQELDFAGLAEQAFIAILRLLQKQLPADNWRAELQDIKQGAYAWRQLILFLSHLSQDKAAISLEKMRLSLKQQNADFIQRFDPMLRGLENVFQGRPLSENGGLLYLGWTTKSHPLQRSP